MKKSVKILIAILALITLLPTTVFAADKTVNDQVMCGDGDTGIPLSYEEQLVQIEEDETLTPEQKEIQKEKLTFGEQINQIERNGGLSRAEKNSRLYRLSGDLRSRWQPPSACMCSTLSRKQVITADRLLRGRQLPQF